MLSLLELGPSSNTAAASIDSSLPDSALHHMYKSEPRVASPPVFCNVVPPNFASVVPCKVSLFALGNNCRQRAIWGTGQLAWPFTLQAQSCSTLFTGMLLLAYGPQAFLSQTAALVESCSACDACAITSV